MGYIVEKFYTLVVMPRPSICPVAKSSHVLVFCVNFELLEIIAFTLKDPCYVFIAVSSLQHILLH